MLACATRGGGRSEGEIRSDRPTYIVTNRAAYIAKNNICYQAGVALGLAWTSMGGSTLYIETLGQKVKEAGTGGGLDVTGNLGDVMKESIKIAGTFARVFLEKKDESNVYFADHK